MTKKTMSNFRKFTIVAQDPSVRIGGRILTEQIVVPAEVMVAGPGGYRVQVTDYDISSRTLYKPLPVSLDEDPFLNVGNRQILSNPNFHAQNVYAITMRTLARFEHALGRRVPWSSGIQQIRAVPHAFADANAYYSANDRALLFGYFPGRTGMVFSCLSHDVIVHETTHALVDGLRWYYSYPTSVEQEAFHEGFADTVALLSVFSLPAVVRLLLDSHPTTNGAGRISSLVSPKYLTAEALRQSALFGLAEQMGQELSQLRGDALRTSLKLKQSSWLVKSPEFQEPHRRGELLVAAMLNAFIKVWVNRLKGLGAVTAGKLDRDRVVEEGANAADYLLTMTIRALDYTPPVDLQFSDFLSALITADSEIRPDDSKYHFRRLLLKSFGRYGIKPSSSGYASEPGAWNPCQDMLFYERTHFESMQRDPVEVFRFIWENRKALGIREDTYNSVSWVRPCHRVGPDGFILRETVIEYIQMLRLRASDLKKLKLHIPVDMDPDKEVPLWGGGTLVFDEYGRLKFHIRNDILNLEQQSRRLQYLWERGFFEYRPALHFSIGAMHRRRAYNSYRG